MVKKNEKEMQQTEQDAFTYLQQMQSMSLLIPKRKKAYIENQLRQRNNEMELA